MTDRQEVWMRAWCAVASCFNGSSEASTRYADACLTAFDERWPKTPLTATWCGKSIMELSPDERQDMREWLEGNI